MKIARVQTNERELTARIEGEKLIVLEGTPIAPGPETGEVLDIATVKFLVPSSPSKIVAIGINYMDHAGDRTAPTEPQPFLKTPSSLIGHQEEIVLPADSTNVHMEAELV